MRLLLELRHAITAVTLEDYIYAGFETRKELSGFRQDEKVPNICADADVVAFRGDRRCICLSIVHVLFTIE